MARLIKIARRNTVAKVVRRLAASREPPVSSFIQSSFCNELTDTNRESTERPKNFSRKHSADLAPEATAGSLRHLKSPMTAACAKLKAELADACAKPPFCLIPI